MPRRVMREIFTELTDLSKSHTDTILMEILNELREQKTILSNLAVTPMENRRFDTDSLLTVKETAAVLKRKTSYVYMLVRERRIPFSKIKGTVYIKKSNIEKIINKTEVADFKTALDNLKK